MSKQFTVTVPVTFTDSNGQDRTTFRRVGALFENTRRETGDVFFKLVLDYPVGVTEMVIFPKGDKRAEE